MALHIQKLSFLSALLLASVVTASDQRSHPAVTLLRKLPGGHLVTPEDRPQFFARMLGDIGEGVKKCAVGKEETGIAHLNAAFDELDGRLAKSRLPEQQSSFLGDLNNDLLTKIPFGNIDNSEALTVLCSRFAQLLAKIPENTGPERLQRMVAYVRSNPNDKTAVLSYSGQSKCSEFDVEEGFEDALSKGHFNRARTLLSWVQQSKLPYTLLLNFAIAHRGSQSFADELATYLTQAPHLQALPSEKTLPRLVEAAHAQIMSSEQLQTITLELQAVVNGLVGEADNPHYAQNITATRPHVVGLLQHGASSQIDILPAATCEYLIAHTTDNSKILNFIIESGLLAQLIRKQPHEVARIFLWEGGQNALAWSNEGTLQKFFKSLHALTDPTCTATYIAPENVSHRHDKTRFVVLSEHIAALVRTLIWAIEQNIYSQEENPTKDQVRLLLKLLKTYGATLNTTIMLGAQVNPAHHSSFANSSCWDGKTFSEMIETIRQNKHSLPEFSSDKTPLTTHQRQLLNTVLKKLQ